MASSTAPAIAGYTVESLIGEGGFGQVWRARTTDGRLVALKVLHLELVRSNDAMTRFERELEAIDRLRNPHVVAALDHGTLADGRPYLVLEFIAGPSLRDVIHERGALPPSEVLRILTPLCSALADAHAAGLVHRDVKASNVILGNHDGKLRPVLLDFGLVKLLDQQGPGLTSSRSMLGTPAAMAPEQMRGLAVDQRTDVYAIGLLSFHMLTGQPAFGGAPGVVQSYLQVHGPRPRPSAKVDIDPAIDEPIIKALATDPAARFPNVNDFVEALRSVIEPTSTELTAEIDVVVLYAEASASEIARVTDIAVSTGMTVALPAPDSVLAVAPIDRIDIASLKQALANFGQTSIALGVSRASFVGDQVEGPALDVEGWASYPLPCGLWVADGL